MAKIGIIGAGQVGATCAFALATSALAQEISLIDINENKAQGEALDIEHGVALMAPVKVEGGGYELLNDSDLVIMTAGANHSPGQTRRDLLGKNTEVMRQAAVQIAERAPNAVVLVVTNPVDALTDTAIEATGFPPERVIGSGTVLDSLRLRHMLWEHTGVDARSIHAYVLGEHGESELPAWSTMSIAGMTLDEYCRDCGACEMRLPDRMRVAFDANVRHAADQIIGLKGSTYYAIALSTRRIAQAILRDERSILTVSSRLLGEYGIHDVCVSVPCIVGRSGIVRRIPVKLTPEEESALRNSAKAVRAMHMEAQFA